MAELNLTEDQVAAYAEAMGVEADDVTPETLAAYHVELNEKLVAYEAEEREFSDEQKSELEERVTAAEAKADAAERRFYEDDRNRVIDAAITDFKIDPAKREDWIARYDENPELTRTFMEELEPKEPLTRMYGDDPQGDEGDRQYGDWAERSGVTRPGGEE